MRWSKWAVISALWLATFRSDGQQIDLGSGDIDFLQLPFNTEFIRKNHVAAIHIEEQIKRNNQPIRPSGLTKTYTFSKSGQCTSRSSYRDRYGRRDTIFEHYRLSLNDNVVQYDRKDRGGFYRETFEHTNDTMTICSYRGKHYDQEATWLSCEHHIKRREAGREFTTVLNENGLPYLHRERSFDHNGYLVEFSETYLISRKRTTTEYVYNERGRLQFRRRSNESINEEWSYSYDHDGTLTEVYYRVNGTLVWRRTIVQDDYGLIAAILTLDQKTEDIVIEKFRYDFDR
jgi:hypothetical protein